MSGTLYVVATPIGNLEDLTPRAHQTLAQVALIAAEDTRHTGRLLSHFGLKTALMALHEHNEEQVVPAIVERLAGGQSVALVSDAGTPLVSDPGYRLVRAAHAESITVSPLPGASAVTAALSVAGLPTDRFCFEGFAPARGAARRQWLESLSAETRTLVMYVAVHRIGDCLADMVEAFGPERQAFIGRELTKMHEQTIRGPLSALCRMLDDETIASKGEFVVVVEGAREQPRSDVDVDRLLRDLREHLPAKVAAAIAARATGARKNALYQRLLELEAPEDPD